MTIQKNIKQQFRKIIDKLNEETGKAIDLDNGWGLYLPKSLKPIFGNLPKNVFYLERGNKLFAAPLPTEFILKPNLAFTMN